MQRMMHRSHVGDNRVVSADRVAALVITVRSKVKSRSDHDVAHLHPLTNVPTTYQLLIPYSFRDIAPTKIYRSKPLQQGQIKVTP